VSFNTFLLAHFGGISTSARLPQEHTLAGRYISMETKWPLWKTIQQKQLTLTIRRHIWTVINDKCTWWTI